MADESVESVHQANNLKQPSSPKTQLSDGFVQSVETPQKLFCDEDRDGASAELDIQNGLDDCKEANLSSSNEDMVGSHKGTNSDTYQSEDVKVLADTDYVNEKVYNVDSPADKVADMPNDVKIEFPGIDSSRNIVNDIISDGLRSDGNVQATACDILDVQSNSGLETVSSSLTVYQIEHNENAEQISQNVAADVVDSGLPVDFANSNKHESMDVSSPMDVDQQPQSEPVIACPSPDEDGIDQEAAMDCVQIDAHVAHLDSDLHEDGNEPMSVDQDAVVINVSEENADSAAVQANVEETETMNCHQVVDSRDEDRPVCSEESYGGEITSPGKDKDDLRSTDETLQDHDEGVDEVDACFTSQVDSGTSPTSEYCQGDENSDKSFAPQGDNGTSLTGEDCQVDEHSDESFAPQGVSGRSPTDEDCQVDSCLDETGHTDNNSEVITHSPAEETICIDNQVDEVTQGEDQVSKTIEGLRKSQTEETVDESAANKQSEKNADENDANDVEDDDFTVELEPDEVDYAEATDDAQCKQGELTAETASEVQDCSTEHSESITMEIPVEKSDVEVVENSKNAHSESSVTRENYVAVEPSDVEVLVVDSSEEKDVNEVPDVSSGSKKHIKPSEKRDSCANVIAEIDLTDTADVSPGTSNLGTDRVAAEKHTVKSLSKPVGPSKPNKKQECLVCKKVSKCKYNIVRNGDTQHLCEDACFKIFRAKPTNFIRSQSAAKKLNEANPGAAASTTTHAGVAVAPSTTTHTGSASNTATHAGVAPSRGVSKKIACDNCQKSIGATAKSTLKIGKESKKFCTQVCMNDFKKHVKSCGACKKDILNEPGAVTTLIKLLSGSMELKGFCSRTCLTRLNTETFTAMKATAKERTAACSVCSKVGPVIQEVSLGNITHHLCSEPCFSAFRYANKLPTHVCDECQKSCTADVVASNTIQFDGSERKFCGAECLASFRGRRKSEVACEWCCTRCINFDMVERKDSNGRIQRFCTLSCLSLYRVNQQANSRDSIQCDQCKLFVPAKFHLTMSDASVRNFCSYPCVDAFQAQFALPSDNLPSVAAATAPMPGLKVTANAANAKASPAAEMPPPSKPSVYGTRQSTRVKQIAAVPISKGTTISVNLPPPPTPPKGRTSMASSGQQKPPVAQKQTQNLPKVSPNSTAQKSAPTGFKSAAKSVEAATDTNTAAVSAPVIVQPPAPKEQRNKAVLCKPFMQTKAISCRPHSITKSTQTEENWEPKRMLLPCPVPLMMPAPMAMYTTPTPIPIFIPVPIPVPCFIPTTRKTSKKIFKKIKDMQERMPSNPYEADLLMMAEAVATDGTRGYNNDSDGSDDEPDHYDPPSPDDESVPLSHPSASAPLNVSALAASGTAPAAGNGELGEDMLQMALRMASEMSEEPMLDLEDNVNAAPVRRVERPPPVQEFSTISQDIDVIQAVSPPGRGRGANRGKRRSSAGTPGGGSASRNRSAPKRARVDEVAIASQAVLPAATPVSVPQPPADANCMLKFTYGVNAYKHWVIQKNAQLEKASASSGGSRMPGGRALKPLKLDPLHCTADELNGALCIFVREVRKPNGEQYAPDSILYLCLGLLVCRIEEEHLWESKQLGAHSPHVLLNTLIYFNTKHFMLRVPTEHLALSFSHIMKHWKKTSSPSGKQGRSVYLRYYSPAQSSKDSTDSSGQKRRKEEMPVFEQAENVDNPLRCPVKLYEFYLSKCPESIKNRNDVFYLVPERSCVPDSPVWYSTMSLGLDAMTKMLNRLRPVREIQEAHLQASQIGMPGPYYS